MNAVLSLIGCPDEFNPKGKLTTWGNITATVVFTLKILFLEKKKQSDVFLQNGSKLCKPELCRDVIVKYMIWKPLDFNHPSFHELVAVAFMVNVCIMVL